MSLGFDFDLFTPIDRLPTLAQLAFIASGFTANQVAQFLFIDIGGQRYECWMHGKCLLTWVGKKWVVSPEQ